ncbi:hypothetical protein LS70_009760 [Helicobacter sp. MIT 11-5569]|uniref:hypothetical protein n=1 Tax=Helicobacter sp. MIT 11-5569 TaxID=1548151 RepID=UPI00051FB41A|nr:hypothetical protein [Helicobacter sp. MIT 11-5569]TLD79700.1 hypothetical protein LS70_009760 [Helicobacter sp. MIT 11-5569]
MKKILIMIALGLQCAFCIDLEEIANRKFYEVGEWGEDSVLAKASNVKRGDLVMYVFFTPHLIFEPNYLIIDTKENVLVDAHFADGDSHSKVNIKQDEFYQRDDILIWDYMEFKWKDKI